MQRCASRCIAWGPRCSRPRRRSEKKGYQGSSTACPACHETARCVAYRGKTLVSLLGPVHLERHYYHCPACGHLHHLLELVRLGFAVLSFLQIERLWLVTQVFKRSF